ncbi:MAG: Gfo/Idh/MocA family oxidoreductase [Coxiellaceae bacterium]|nr:Gfo/Idh/MocA family oxidoreductase [Coxiellaceae bacterium]
MTNIKLGVIGGSEGNGHPYSWSAIINGYDQSHMEKCPYPMIPRYLSAQEFPQDTITGAEVTHIWTQDYSLSQHIASASLIKNVTKKASEMIGNVDAILFARDDAENHYEMTKAFIDAGLPIYIDKPLAYTVNEAKKILSKEKYIGQIFSCSALAYAKEFQLSTEDLRNIGDITHINAQVVKSWKKYAVHVIEPVLNLFDNPTISKCHSSHKNGITNLSVNLSENISANFISSHSSDFPIEIAIFGKNGYKKLVFNDTFYAFKQALMHFLGIINDSHKPKSHDKMLTTVKLIELGMT